MDPTDPLIAILRGQSGPPVTPYDSMIPQSHKMMKCCQEMLFCLICIVSDSAALVLEIIANNKAALADRGIARLTRTVLKTTRSGNQEATVAAAALLPGLTCEL